MSEHGGHSRSEEGSGKQSRLLDHETLIHDVRNGLSAILMQAQLLSHYAETPAADVDAIKRSVSAIEQSVRAIVIVLDNS